MNSRAIYLFLIIITIACKEVYYHDAGYIGDILVVEGLITDKPGEHLVRLTYNRKIENHLTGDAGRNSNQFPVGVSGATVYVKSDDGTVYPFSERREGNYHPGAGFAGVPGQTYTLYIELPDGETYISAPQVMPVKTAVDSLYAESRELITLSLSGQGRYFRRRIPGVNVFLDMKGEEGELPLFRLVPELLLLYTVPVGELEKYCWKRIRLPGEVNVNVQKFDPVSDMVRKHEVTFLPVQNFEYPLEQENNELLHRKILIINHFSLNREAWEFYSGIQKQINSEGKIFDPLASQLPSNITCVTDPSRTALGLFEVSPVTVGTWLLVEKPWEDSYSFRNLENIEGIPDEDCSLFQPPFFWVN